MPAPKIPEVGKKAPSFNLKTYDGEPVKLAKLLDEGQYVVLYFYPKDMTPGCTKEACAFQEDLTKFKRNKAAVVGVSPDSVEMHEKFRDKYKLKFPLLADKDAKLAQKYGVWVEKNMYGRKFMGIQRATFLIDPRGKVAAAWPKVKVAGHS